MRDRRSFLKSVALCGAVVLLPGIAEPGPRRRRKRRRKARRRTRRRIRRRAAWRSVRGRRRLVVPVAVAVGWELTVDDRVVVVTEVHDERIVVENDDGSTESIDVIKEDTAENSNDLDDDDSSDSDSSSEAGGR